MVLIIRPMYLHAGIQSVKYIELVYNLNIKLHMKTFLMVVYKDNIFDCILITGREFTTIVGSNLAQNKCIL